MDYVVTVDGTPLVITIDTHALVGRIIADVHEGKLTEGTGARLLDIDRIDLRLLRFDVFKLEVGT